MVTEVVMLVIATAFTRLSVVHTRATDEFSLDEVSLDEFSFHSEIIKEFYNEDDMTPEFTEQLSSYEISEPIKKLAHITNEKRLSMKNEENATGLTPKVTRQAIQSDTKKQPIHIEEVKVNRQAIQRDTKKQPIYREEVKVNRQAIQRDTKKQPIHSEEVDVVDREDHVTQYLADLLVNTDSEITSLQGSELDDEQREELGVKADLFFNFLTGRQKVIEVEGAGPAPAPTPEDSKDADNLMNVIVYWIK